MLNYYSIVFILSVLCAGIYMIKWNKRINISYSILILLIVVSELGFLVLSISTELQTAYFANMISYIGACYLQIIITFCIFSLCKIEVSRLFRPLMILGATSLYMFIFTDPVTHWYYKSVSINSLDGVTILEKEYGPLHSFFYVILLTYFMINIGIMYYAWTKKKKASVQCVFMLFLIEFVNLLVYFIQKFFPDGLNLLPLSYLISELIIIIMISRLTQYDVDTTVVNAMLNADILGCFSFSLSGKYLGCNSICEKWFPELMALKVDERISEDNNTTLFVSIKNWIKEIEKEGASKNFHFKKESAIYHINGGYFCEGRKRLGFQFSVQDNTKEHKYMELLNGYNNQLENEVEEKTKNLREMHAKMIIGMANLVESRDNSTGHHIKRTSEGVRILISKILEDNKLKLDKKFCEAVIKAAPMHDLGKIAVDDSILRKPAKFTDEEFEIMKSHTSEGAKIVRKILLDTQDDYFAQIAENVAHYHHEKFDGSGYPCKLKGTEIPLEARIMAVADVYDALVSRRCYKAGMSFDESFQIILDGMGTHFDPQLLPYVLAAKTELEKYYSREFQL